MEKTKRLALSAMLTSLALGLSYAERFIPLQLIVPLPGIKLGLANIVTIFALYFLDVKSAFFILTIRCALGSMFGGGLTGFFFSIGGGLCAMAVMALMRRIPVVSIYGVSISGAAAHNFGQILIASILMKSVYVITYLPFLLFVSVATGFLTGTVASSCFRALMASGLSFQSNREISYVGNTR